MHLQYTPIYYVKYRNEKCEDKALRELINEEGVAEVTNKIEERMNMRSSVKMEHCFGGKETLETTRRRKAPRLLFCTFKDRRKKLHERQDVPKTTTTKGSICIKEIW